MKNRHATSLQAGFTLVEIMIGLAIGMLATLVIMQVFSVFEAQKRTTTGTADAQTNGSIALYSIARETEMAGFPLVPTGKTGARDSAIECTGLTVDGVATPLSALAAVVLTDGANGSSDTITIHYGTSTSGGLPATINVLAGNDVSVTSNLGCQPGDRTLIVNNANCAISTASAVSAAGVNPQTVTLLDTSQAVTGADLACLGNWNTITYTANNGNLERNGTPTLAGIVNIQAQYGISAVVTSNDVVNWVDPTGTWANPTVDDRNRIKAIRVAVVARNPKLEGADVTAICTTAKGTVNDGPCAWDDTSTDAAPMLKLANDPDGTSWHRYRYRVFETIIPLRDVIWSQRTL